LNDVPETRLTKSEFAAEAAQAEARERIERLLERSPAARGLGIEVLDAGTGRAALGFEVTEAMVNSEGVCHGGYLFSLADAAAAYACLTRHARAATQGAHITFVAPARVGERLRAEAEEVLHAKRNTVYDVRITNPGGHTVALVRAHIRLFEAGADKPDR
jgi:acyl-CoA thioesterase